MTRPSGRRFYSARHTQHVTTAEYVQRSGTPLRSLHGMECRAKKAEKSWPRCMVNTRATAGEGFCFSYTGRFAPSVTSGVACFGQARENGSADPSTASPLPDYCRACPPLMRSVVVFAPPGQGSYCTCVRDGSVFGPLMTHLFCCILIATAVSRQTPQLLEPPPLPPLLLPLLPLQQQKKQQQQRGSVRPRRRCGCKKKRTESDGESKPRCWK